MTTPLVLDAIEHAIWTRCREGITDLSGLIHHNDRGFQYTSIAFTDKLIAVGIDASIGATEQEAEVMRRAVAYLSRDVNPK